MRSDWKETSEAHVLKADLPGLKKEEVKVEVEEDRIFQINGERAKEHEEKTNTWHWSERSSRKFLRRFRLSANVKLEEVKIAYRECSEGCRRREQIRQIGGERCSKWWLPEMRGRRSVRELPYFRRGERNRKREKSGMGRRRSLFIGLFLALAFGVTVYFRLWIIGYKISADDAELIRFSL